MNRGQASSLPPPIGMTMRAQHLGRLATLAIVPAMMFLIVWARGAVPSETTDDERLAPSGTILVGTLREPALVSVQLGRQTQRRLALPGPAHELLVLGDRAYITLGRAHLLAEVQLPSLALLRTTMLEGEPHGIAWWRDRIAVSLDTMHAVVSLDPATLTERGRWTVGDTPHALATADGDLYIAEARSGTLRRIGSGVIAAPGGMPESLAIVDGAVVVALADRGAIAVVPLDAPTAVAIVDVGPRPSRVAAAGGGKLAVALSGSGQVALYEGVGSALIWRVTVGQLADGLCASPDFRFIAATAPGEDRLLILDIQSGEVVARFTVNGGPGACVWLDR